MSSSGWMWAPLSLLFSVLLLISSISGILWLSVVMGGLWLVSCIMSWIVLLREYRKNKELDK